MSAFGVAILIIYSLLSIGVLIPGISCLSKGENIFEGFTQATVGELLLVLIFLPTFTFLGFLQISRKFLSFQPFKRK